MIRFYSNISVEKRVISAFLLLILLGAGLLWLCNRSFHPLHPLDALFTATSAVCVTGLIVVDTGSDLSGASQMVVLLLFQLGGLGVVTASLTLLVAMRQRVGIRSRLLFANTLGRETPSGAIRLLLAMLKITFGMELLGALCMLPSFAKELPFSQACFAAAFHSVSAFCNAGFSLFSTSLQGYQTSLVVPGTVMFLIVVGGLGFPVWLELGGNLFSHDGTRLSVGSRLVLLTTAMLLFLGTLGVLLTEWNRSLGSLSPFWKVWNALFASVTARTAGFDTVPPGAFSSAGIMIMLLLMMVGASPASTGGGLKTTTLAVVGLAVTKEISGFQEINLWGRRIPFRTLLRALVLLVLYLGTLFAGVVLLALFEPFPLRDMAFEVFSALGTVGLSTGITSQLSPAGKILLMVLMFWGRVGILTFMSGIFRSPEQSKLTYPTTQIPLG